MQKSARLLENNVHPANRGLAISLRSFLFHLTDDFDVDTLSHVFHRFPKHGVAHELVEVYLKPVFGLLPKFCVHLDI